MAGLVILLFAIGFARRADDDFKLNGSCQAYGCGNYYNFTSYEQCEFVPSFNHSTPVSGIVELNPCDIDQQCNTNLKNANMSTCGYLKDRYGDETCLIYNKTSTDSSCVSNLSCTKGKCKTTGSCKTTEECGFG